MKQKYKCWNNTDELWGFINFNVSGNYSLMVYNKTSFDIKFSTGW